MQVVILTGGKGTRISEETQIMPKPMLMVGDKPILHHIMDIFIKYGYNDFIIAAGYKKEFIYAYFLSLSNGLSGISAYSPSESIIRFQFKECKVAIIDTGLETQTGGRLKRLAPFIKDNFFMTYGDGLANVDISRLENGHYYSPKFLATVTAVRPLPRFGEMRIDNGLVTEFREKPEHGIMRSDGWINGGFFILDPRVLDMITSDDTNFESEIIPKLVDQRQLTAYIHDDFWQCVDTLRDLSSIREIYKKDGPVWLK